MARGILALVAAWAAAGFAAPAAAAEWLEVRTTHFVVVTQDSEEHARTFAGRLERYDKGMRVLQHLPENPSDKANPVTIYVVPNLGAIGKLCQGTSFANAKNGCRTIGGWYEGRVSGSVAFIPRPSGSAEVPDESAMTMFHEYAHHFMLSNFNGVYPAWYVEGFAEFHATASFESKGMVGFGKPQSDRMRWLIYRGGLPIEKLLTSNVAALDTDDRQSFYSKGWLLVHYLTFEKSRVGQLQIYLRELNAGKASLDAARTAFGDLTKLDHELDGYLHSESLYYVRFQVPELAGDAITVRRLSAGEAAVMPVRLQSDRGVDDASAKTVVADARRLAAPYPNDPGAQIALAEAEYDAGNDDAAQAAADRALAAQPTNRTAMEYEGMARIHRLRNAQGGDARAWQEARSWFIRANHLEPEDGWALERFYRSFLAEGVAPTKSAVAGLEVAFAAVPQDRGLRMTLAMQYLHDGKKKDARLLLAPLAYDPHAAPDNAARRMITLIDKDDGAAITTALRTGKLDEDDAGDDSAAGPGGTDDSKAAPGGKGGGKSGPAK
jgi:hypothetical protein